MNWIDKTISLIAPQVAVHRARARIQLEQLDRIGAEAQRFSYEAAKVGRRTGDWVASGTDPNAEIGPALVTLRGRARDLCRNDPYAKRAIAEIVGHLVGTGIMPRADTGDKDLNKIIDEAHKRWSDECDADGQLDYFGLQWQLAKAVPESGEALVRFRPRRASDGLYIPLQMQVIEPDFLDTHKTQLTQTGSIIHGVEFDKIGKRIAYWLFGNHPGAVLLTNGRGLTSAAVPAFENGSPNVLHLYIKDRPGQVRGVTWFAAAILRLRDLGTYDEAVWMRKRLEACIGLLVESPEGEATMLGASEEKDDGRIVEKMEPGMIIKTRAGQTVKGFDPTPSEGASRYRTELLQAVAASLGPTYEQITGDLSNVNYSSYRAGENGFDNTIEALRWLCMIPMALRPMYCRFIDAAYLAGVIPERNYGVRWTAPGKKSIDPLKDANARQINIRNGIQTWPEAVAEAGFDPDEQISEIEQWNKTWDERGVILDCDPRKTASNGNQTGVTNDKPAAA